MKSQATPTGPGGRGAALLAVALLGTYLNVATGAVAGTIQDPVYFPAGISDAGGSVGCLSTPAGGVEVVDHATGRSLWWSAAPARCLLVTGGRAFVLEERTEQGLGVAAYAARNGRLIRGYDLSSLGLPPWASLTGARERRQWAEFEVAARLAGDGLEVSYKARRRQVAGFPAPSVVDQVEGVALVSLDSGRVDLRSGPGPPPPLLSEPAPPMPGVRFVSVHARAADATIVLGGPPANVDHVLIVGDRRFAFELSRDTTTVIVHCWSAHGGAREAPLRLDHGQATDAVWVTLDRRHVLLRRADEQRWYDLYSLETGKSKGKLERPADVAVVGSRVYWTALDRKGRLVLVATDAESGRRLWRRTVRDAEGPLPDPIP